MSKIFKDLIIDICKENNIKYTFLSKDWVIMLEKDNKKRFICGYKFDLNTQSISLVLDDKYALYDTLNNLNINVCEHKIIYNENNHNDYAKDCNKKEIVHKYFNEHNKQIVIKANDKSCGIDVYKINNEKDIDDLLNKLFINNYSLSLSPYYNIKNEYRLIILNNNIELIYGKTRPIVKGNGIKTVKELLLEFNYPYFKNINLDKYDYILNKDELFEYSWKFNLSGGATFFYEDNVEILNKLKSITNEILSKLDIKFGSIDIINSDEGFLVLEINSGVMMDNFINMDKDGYNKAKQIYTKVIFEMFK